MKLFAFFFVLLLFQYCFACFINDCPMNGKRKRNQQIRLCPRCGFNQEGTCFGPKICCSLAGCLINNGAQTATCRVETLRNDPCGAGFTACGPYGKGRCALSSICCEAEGCYEDARCSVVFMTEQPEEAHDHPEMNPLLHLAEADPAFFNANPVPVVL